MAFRVRSVTLQRWGHGSRSRLLGSVRGLATLSDGSRYALVFPIAIPLFRILHLVHGINARGAGHTMSSSLEVDTLARKPALRQLARVLALR